MERLTRDDIIILAPRVLDELSRVFTFQDGHVVIGPDLACGIYASFPKTMAKRAHDAIASGKPVWDRVNNQVWLPLSSVNGGTTLGAMTLKGVARTVCPEEGERWLPVLSSLVASLYCISKEKSLLKETSGIPEYLSLFLKAQDKEALYPGLSYILFRKASARTSKANGLPLVFKKAIFLGSARDGGEWWLVQGARQKVPIYFERLLRQGSKKVFLFDREGCMDETTLLEHKWELEVASRRLGFRCLASHLLLRLKEKACIGDLPVFFSALEKGGISRKLDEDDVIVGIYRCERPLSPVSPLDRQGITPFFESRDLVLYRLTRTLFEGIREEVAQLAATNGLRIAIIDVKGIGSRAEAMKMLFWAGVHGSLLPKGSVFETGSLTYQVAGDECFSHGDIQAAIGYYKAALKLDKKNVDAMNSLGVCLARLGRRKFAQEAFKQAISQAPKDPMGYYNLGCVLMESRDIKGAVKALSQAYQYAPRDPLIVARYLEALLESRRDQVAQGVAEELERLIGHDSTPQPWVLRVVARAHFFLGDARGASIFSRKVLAQSPNDPEALFICAVDLMAREGKSDNVQKLLQGIDPTKMRSMRIRSKYFLFKKKK